MSRAAVRSVVDAALQQLQAVTIVLASSFVFRPQTRVDAGSYQGDWVNDNRHGEGQLTYPNGEKYVGQWRMGHREGEGEAKYADGSK